MKDIVVVFSYDEKESDQVKFTLSDDSSRDWQKLDTGREVLLVQKAPAESAKEGYRQTVP